MTLALRLVLYVAVTAGLFGSLASGVWWLITPDPTLQQPLEAKAAPIPPRIAESIEGRVPMPVQEPQPVRAAPPPPPMQEAVVSLPVPPLVEQKPTHRAVRVTRGTKSREKEPPSVETYVVPVTTRRTDFPF
jgi:hypothetical protein